MANSENSISTGLPMRLQTGSSQVEIIDHRQIAPLAITITGIHPAPRMLRLPNFLPTYSLTHCNNKHPNLEIAQVEEGRKKARKREKLSTAPPLARGEILPFLSLFCGGASGRGERVSARKYNPVARSSIWGLLHLHHRHQSQNVLAQCVVSATMACCRFFSPTTGTTVLLLLVPPSYYY